MWGKSAWAVEDVLDVHYGDGPRDLGQIFMNATRDVALACGFNSITPYLQKLRSMGPDILKLLPESVES